MGGVVSNGASAPSFDRLVNRIIDCSIGSFVCVCGGGNFAQICSILLEFLPLHLRYGL